MREQLRASQGELARRDQVAFLLEDPRLMLDGQCGEVEVGIGADERLQNRLIARVLVFAESGVPARCQPLQVRGGKGNARCGIALVKAEQRLVKADGFKHG